MSFDALDTCDGGLNFHVHKKSGARTALQHDGARLEGVYDGLHDGLEQAVKRGVVRPVPQRHVHAVVLAVLLQQACGRQRQADPFERVVRRPS